MDDDRDIRETIRDVLAIEGYKVVVAADGASALELLRRGGVSPCLILLDLMMPVMNGWELRAELRKIPALDSIPVVVLSGDGSAAAKAEAMHAAGHLTKPFDLDPLLECIGRFCPARK